MPVEPQSAEPLEVFYSYSHKDKELRDELEKSLIMLRRDGVIKNWHDRQIVAGTKWGSDIDEHLNSADIILLLVIPDFLASDYCYDIEVTRAMDRHEAGEALVIPIILRACDWTPAPFSKIQGLPRNALPVKKWADIDEAFLDITMGIRKAAGDLLSTRILNNTTPSDTSEVSLPPTIPRPPVVGFVARRDTEGRDILERLNEELAPGKNQLVVLSGPGGVGKTTLAAETARALLPEFANRIVWISASGREDFALNTLFDEIVTQLGRADLRPLAPAQKEEQVRALIAVPATLVVLDNFETIKPAEQTRCVEFLSNRANCPALITTRQKINPARNIPIAVMSPEEAFDFLRRLIEQANDPNAFAGLDRERIMKASERNPLVLQWVVAQIDLAQEAETVLNELSHGTGDAARRVFNRSFELEQVGEDGRAALLALSLFVPDASRPALVAGFGEDVGRLNEAVKNLAALWLVKTAPGGRLTVQGLTRELTKAHLSGDKRAAEFGQRFVASFLSYAEAHEQPTPEDYEALEAERDNLLGAMDVAFSLRDWNSVHAIAYALAKPVSGMLSVHGYWDEAIHRNEQALNAARESADEREIAAFAHNAAVMYQFRGELKEARKLYNESLEIKKQLGNQRGIARTLHELGRLVQGEGKLEEARKLYNESLEIEKKLGNQTGIALSLGQLGVLAAREGNNTEAARLYREALSIFERLGSPNAKVARLDLKRVESKSE